MNKNIFILLFAALIVFGVYSYFNNKNKIVTETLGEKLETRLKTAVKTAVKEEFQNHKLKDSSQS